LPRKYIAQSAKAILTPLSLSLSRYVSPRSRAQKTLELLDLGCHDPYPWQVSHQQSSSIRTDAKATVTPDIREWDYGEYEGITSEEIRKRREEQGLGPWDIWTDGCPGGESPEDIIERVDRLIKEIRDEYHGPVIGKPKAKGVRGDVLVVGHGHILRAFAIRWVGKPLSETAFIMEPGGVGTLR
jgi:broad specificity phosphatase PhoE